MSRADRFTALNKKPERYSDFLDNFDINPVTGFLAKVTNEDAVKQALKNIILTNMGERFYDSMKGSKIRASLFDLFDPANIEVMKLQITNTLNAYEPRAILEDIKITDDSAHNAYNVDIVFSIINIPTQQFFLNFSINRVR